MLLRGADSLKINPSVPKRAGGFFCFCAIANIGQRAKLPTEPVFSRSGNKCFYVSGIKKASPRFSAGAKKGLRRKKAAQEGGAGERTYREKCSPVQGRKRYVSPKAPRHSISQEKEREFVCPYYIRVGRKKKYSVGIQSENFSRMKPERRPGSRARK